MAQEGSKTNWPILPHAQLAHTLTTHNSTDRQKERAQAQALPQPTRLCGSIKVSNTGPRHINVSHMQASSSSDHRNAADSIQSGSRKTHRCKHKLGVLGPDEVRLCILTNITQRPAQGTVLSHDSCEDQFSNVDPGRAALGGSCSIITIYLFAG